MPRIVAGEAGGQRLAVPAGERTRPTSDRTREALFAALGALVDLDGARVLDLYAGSGAVGLEAVSRGAAEAVLVDADARAAATAAANAAALGLADRVTVRRDRVERVLAAGPAGGQVDLVFADPPYALTGADLDAALALLARHEWLAPGAVLVVERASRGQGPTWPEGVRPVRSRRYGEGTLWYGQVS
ncbi:MAG TPA: 16S rRNA (guanine(966)-N(2))-methyltransferase RsmD [Mycobacteriales bacterium]|nr:16S rRNA (guanine(966)-N(2))-methyltransferase RsmD [Mycobacteriales bacterium]